MAARHLRIGDTAVDLILDGHLVEQRSNLLHNAGAAALDSLFADGDERSLRIGVNFYLLRGPRGIELVDAGAGPSRGSDLGHGRAGLAAFGVSPIEVDRVFLTHCHFDHALGLLDGDAAHFPRAELIVPALDIAYYTDPAERARLPSAWHPIFDDTARVAAAYAGRLRRAPFGPVMPGVDLLPVPGHTLGQGGYLFGAGNGALLLFGDLLHFETEQAADPDLGLVYDHDPTTAADTRRAVLGRAAAEGWIVGGGHLRGFGRVTPDGTGFRIAPVA